VGFSTAGTIVGRGAEQKELAALLVDRSLRLVTVTGRGGVGKTRLTAEVVEQSRVDDERVVVVVRLAGVPSADLVISEVAAAFGIAPAQGVEPADALVARLQHEQLLLVLDNFEHVLDAAPAISAVLERCPGVDMLVTSQAPLRLVAERVFELRPLPVDGHAAVALYAERAGAVDRSFALDDGNLSTVVELCGRLEGLPLAIELAAARAATLPAAEILRRLDDSPLGLLRRARGDAPTRHHDLHATIEWTYRLLAPDAQALLCRLAIVSGGFDLDAVEGISAPMTFDDAVDAFATLVDMHLVDPIASRDRARYEIPMSIRAFCVDALTKAGTIRDARREHIAFRVKEARAIAAAITAGDDASAFRTLDDDHRDIVAALESAIDASLASEALDLALALAPLWDMRGYHLAHEILIERTLELGERDAPTAAFVEVLAWSALLGLRQRTYADVDRLAERISRAERVARDIDAGDTLLRVLQCWMLVMPYTGDTERAMAASREALERAATIGDERRLGRIEAWSGMLAQQTGDADRAVALGQSAARRAHRTGDSRTLVLATLLLTTLLRRYPEIAPDVPSFGEALQCARDSGMTLYEAVLLPMMVGAAVVAHDRESVLRWTAASLALARTMPGSPIVEFNLMLMLTTAAVCGDYDVAAYFHGSIRHRVDALSRSMAPQQVEAHDALLARTRRMLGDDRFEAEAARGTRLAPHAAIEEAITYVRDAARRLGVDELEQEPIVGAPREPLTDRQLDVLRLLVTGLGNKEIAAELGISAKTVMHHTTAIYRALRVRGRAEAAVVAIRDHLLR
jgi:predicted ATPase/DNA-binding NarL/FixJ family response regulator